MAKNSSQNKQIAKNTIFLYIRMVVVMLIGLYTSRALLKTLGVEDFGIYGLVGGIVTMFASLKTMFTVATQRFMNIALGNGDGKELNDVFNVSILVNAVIAFVFFVLVEIGGLWLLENKLNISSERMIAANWVFQFSVISSLISIFNIPYDANIIAREKMNVYAIVSIIDALARLGIVLILPFLNGDKLIIYGLLMLGTICLNLCINAVYCRCNFPESKIHRCRFNDVKCKFREMFSFSGWAFFGNVIFALVNEGINVLLNIFGNVLANAARTISYQVRGAINSVVTNVYVAVKPQAIQSYARNDMDRFYKLMFTGGKVVGYMYILIAIPLYFNIEEVLSLWLGSVPEYAVAFLTSGLVYQFVRVLHEPIDSFFVTIGRLKEYQIAEFIALGSALPLSYIGLKFGDMPLYGVFLVMAFSEVLNLFVCIIIAKKIGGFDVRRYCGEVIIPYVALSLLCFLSVYLMKVCLSSIPMSPTLMAFVLIVMSIIIQAIWLYCVGLKKEERQFFMNLIKRNK